MSDRDASLDEASNIAFKALKEKPPAKPVDLYFNKFGSTAHQIKKRCFGGQYKHAQTKIQLPSEPVFEFGGIFLCDGRI